MNKEEIRNITAEVVSRYLVTQESQVEIVDSTPLFGEESLLDSMGLVNVVVDLESEFLNKGIEISLTSKNAMSRSRSPFRTIETLVEFVSEQIHADR